MITPPYLIRQQIDGLKYKKLMEEELSTKLEKTKFSEKLTGKSLHPELYNQDLKSLKNESVRGFVHLDSTQNSKDFHEYIQK